MSVVAGDRTRAMASFKRAQIGGLALAVTAGIGLAAAAGAPNGTPVTAPAIEPSKLAAAPSEPATAAAASDESRSAARESGEGKNETPALPKAAAAYASADPEAPNQANLVQSAIDSKVDGIALTLSTPNAFQAVVQNAQKALQDSARLRPQE